VRGIDDLLRLLTADRIGRRCEVEIVRDGVARHVGLTPHELTA
jgi:hypothetical protein